MGYLSSFNPVRFNEKSGGNYEANSHAINSKTLGAKTNFIQEFLNKAESPYYVKEYSGSYGFESINEFVLSSNPINPRIENWNFCFDSGRLIYSNMDGAIPGRRIKVKFTGTCSIEVRENSATIASFNNVTDGFTYVLDQDYTNLNLTFDNVVAGGLCISAIMVVQDFVEFSFCGVSQKAPLMDITPYGGMYLITSNLVWYELNNSTAEEINTFTLDFSGKHDQTQSVDFYIKIGANDIHLFSSGSASDLDLMNDFILQYDWLNYSIDGLVLTVVIPAIVGSPGLIVYENGALRDTFTFTFVETNIDSEFIYTSGDGNVLGIECVEIIIESFGSLPRNEDFFIAYGGLEDGITRLETNKYYSLDGDIIDFSDESSEYNSSSYIQISKTGKMWNRCCFFDVEDYKSEPVRVVDESEKRLIKYSDSQFRQDLMANFEYSLLLDCNIRRISGSQVDQFEGQKRNYVLKGVVNHNREFQTKEAVPDYLCEILEGVFNCENVSIDDVYYTKSDEPSFDYVDDRVLLCEFSIEMRLN